MKFSVFPATALLSSTSLVFGRPQYSQLQIENFPDPLFNPNTDFNPIISPPPTQINPSSFLSSNNAPNLAMAGAETIPTPDTPVASTKVSTDYSQLITPSGDNSFDIADKLPSLIVAKGAEMLIDSILDEEYTYGVFGLSPDLKQIVSVSGGKSPYWDVFGQHVQPVSVGFALHLIDVGMLLIVSLRIPNPADEDRLAIEQEKPILVLRENEKFLFSLVQGKLVEKYGAYPEKATSLLEVFNDSELEAAINTYSHPRSSLRQPTDSIRSP